MWMTISTLWPGLSPRGRGSPLARCELGFHARSIPAWAGEPIEPQTQLNDMRVYPRVGGGASSIAMFF